ncbi:MAG: hypothetical protein EPO42_06225 [Gallionellaceae bacterium]|nr:MAG: hypothetical protein EPO42_06225 [Gallionellaceae bacterium]
MKLFFPALSILALLNLSACTSKDEGSSKQEAPKAKLFEEQRAVLEDAKGVNKAQQQQNEEQKKAIEQQTQ